MTTPSMPHKIFEYLDYRTYLREYYEFKKEHSRGFSYRTFSNRIGFKTKDFILRVINGTRNLSDASAEAVAKGISLSKWESQFFMALVGFNQARSQQEREGFHIRMREVMEKVRFRDEQHLLNHFQYEIYSRWFILPIRSLIGVWGFDGDYEKLAKSLHPVISADEARYGVDLLKKCKLICKDKEKGFVLTHDAITTGDSVRKIALRDFHQNCLRLAAESIERDPAEKRNISALTLGISQQTYEVIVGRLTEFRKEIAMIAEQDEHADRVMQLNFQIFPISQEKN